MKDAAQAQTVIDQAFLVDAIQGLSAPSKYLPAKYFYDAHGSELFMQICEQEEYYPTRTEIALLRKYAGEIANVIGPGARMIEYGSGATQKVRALLDKLSAPVALAAIDISAEYLEGVMAALQADYPDLDMYPVYGDFTRSLDFPEALKTGNRFGFFPGSTIGNLHPEEAVSFLKTAAKDLGDGAGFLIGVDLRKDPCKLHAAYNDAAGVTAAFNLNVLERANRDLGADFDLSAFDHYAFYNPCEGRVEMHLVSGRKQSVDISGHQFDFDCGESIHTECSYKYTVEGFRHLCAVAGWDVQQTWTDAASLFSLHYMVTNSDAR